MQKTVVLIKPDGVQRDLVGQIITRFERKGLRMAGIKMMYLTDELLDEWYVHHKEKSFFGRLKAFMKSTPIVAMCWEGLEVIDAVRKLCGTTKGSEAEAGSIRGDFAMSISNNLIHASDSEDNAKKELELIFDKDEVFSYEKDNYTHIYAEDER